MCFDKTKKLYKNLTNVDIKQKLLRFIVKRNLLFARNLQGFFHNKKKIGMADFSYL